jgi:hypothetical protein
MKSARIRRDLSRIIIAQIFLICGLTVAVSGQSKTSLTVSLGVPELVNAGLRYNLDQFQIGMNAGVFPDFGSLIVSLSANSYYHFAGESGFTSIRQYYAMAGVCYLHSGTENRTDRHFYLNLRVGKELNLSKMVAFSLDGGIIYQVYYAYTENSPDIGAQKSQRGPDVLPSISLTYIYRLRYRGR